MDRLYYLETSSLVQEKIIYSNKGIRLYDGSNKSEFQGETAHLTAYKLYFTSLKRSTMSLVLDLKSIIYLEEEDGGLLRSNKLVLHLNPSNQDKSLRMVSSSSVASHIKMAFTDGGISQMKSFLEKSLLDKAWEKLSNPVFMPMTSSSSAAKSSGILGIERKIQEKMDNTNSNINVAFQDLKNLIDMAKDMVRLANIMSKKIKDRQGDISDDETVRFKSYLLGLGIDDPIPVTRDACSSNDAYRRQLSKQTADFLVDHISQMGGIMTLSDAFCRVNRARTELLSPEDFLLACRQMNDSDNSPVKMRTFESGVLVLQIQSQTNNQIDLETAKLLENNTNLTAFSLSKILGVSNLIAAERLNSAEKSGLACRDDSVQGLVYHPNRFLSETR